MNTEREFTSTLSIEFFIVIHDGYLNMAGAPDEEPEQFVCMNCHTIAAGFPAEDGAGSKEYKPPAECGACGQDDFVEFARFEREYSRGA